MILIPMICKVNLEDAIYGYMVISWILNALTKNIFESVVYTIGKINIEWKLIV